MNDFFRHLFDQQATDRMLRIVYVVTIVIVAIGMLIGYLLAGWAGKML